MMFFDSIAIMNKSSNTTQPLGKKIIAGVPEGAAAFVVRDQADFSQHVLYIAATDDQAERIYQQLSILLAPSSKPIATYHFPAWDCLPYDRLSPNTDITTKRVETLNALLDIKTSQGPVCVVTSVSAILQKLPPPDSLKNRSIALYPGLTISRDALILSLINNGYQRTETVREAGEYAIRGGIFDIFPIAMRDPIRLDYFGDEIEKIRLFDPLSQKSHGGIDHVRISPVGEITLNEQTISHFRHQFRAQFGAVHHMMYEAISEGRKYVGMDHWLPLFFEKTAILTDYLPSCTCIVDAHVEPAIRNHLQLINDYYHARLQRIPGDKTPPYYPLPPDQLYFSGADLQLFQERTPITHLTSFHVPNALNVKGAAGEDFSIFRRTGQVFDHLKSQLSAYQNQGKQIVFTGMTDGSRDRLLHVFQEHDFPDITITDGWPDDKSPICLTTFPLDHGFILEKLVVITEQDLLGDRIARRPTKQRKADQFFMEAAQLNHGDLVVHQEHGIGRYEGLLAIRVEKAVHDCLILIYDNNDKLFLPVENIELISRYGSDNTLVALDKLGAAGWQTRKAKVKKRIMEIADYLMKLAAERLLHQGELIHSEHQEYEEFCARFPYAETDDQNRAIQEMLTDLASGKPMDRLVCGDVGFGKTEVALRAAFVTAAAGKQVALVVPTTLLCRQHTNTFQHRFEGFPYKVAQLSRFVTKKEADQVKIALATGEIDIVIATHAVFSDSLKFSDLGLLIVDEEQHFGVKQKEKLKSLKKDVHVLTLTATPIPRTLQLALTGVREMSLITTPPIDRLAVRTFVMPYDGVTIREAILREYYRGGQTFYVCPRLDEIEKIKLQLAVLVPEIKVIVAHGQMPASTLEDVMTDFYDRRYDVLLSTNIVESGIDIPNANTLIIHRSDLFGLSQLYQLRGRIGRSKTQGYAYFTLDPDKDITPNAKKRLDIMQTLDTLGAGFTLASHDMDIRGTGNIVGEAQSGHIREVGVELYQQLLQEAILILRAEQASTAPHIKEWSPQINLGVSVMISEAYVRDLGVRLGLYRRAADLETRTEIDAFAAELVDRFGPLPEEVKNLLLTIEIKAFCRQADIEKVDAGSKGVVITFRNHTFKNPDKLWTYLQNPQAKAKIRPDQRVVFLRDWENPHSRLKGTKIICANLAKLAS